MDKTRELLTAYAKANGYEIGADFASKKRRFFKDGAITTKDEIFGSAGFAGFCDGYQNRPHRYKGPVGTPEKDKSNDFSLVVKEAYSLLPENLKEEFRSVTQSVMVSKDYDEQYDLGRSLSR